MPHFKSHAIVATTPVGASHPIYHTSLFDNGASVLTNGFANEWDLLQMAAKSVAPASVA